MALQGFINKNYYSKITHLQVNTEDSIVYIVLSTFDKKGGTKIFNDLSFVISEEEEIKKYIAENFKEIPCPKYPALCAEKEKHVPMWTEKSTKADMDLYNNTLREYEQSVLKYEENVQHQDAQLMHDAKRLNEYRKYFEKSKMLGRSNPAACAYEYIKALPGFVGVNDAQD